MKYKVKIASSFKYRGYMEVIIYKNVHIRVSTKVIIYRNLHIKGYTVPKIYGPSPYLKSFSSDHNFFFKNYML